MDNKQKNVVLLLVFMLFIVILCLMSWKLYDIFGNKTNTIENEGGNYTTNSESDSNMASGVTKPLEKVTVYLEGVGYQTIAKGSKLTKPDKEPVREGYEFVGWYLDGWHDFEDELTTVDGLFNFDATIETDGLKIYYRWEKES